MKKKHSLCSCFTFVVARIFCVSNFSSIFFSFVRSFVIPMMTFWKMIEIRKLDDSKKVRTVPALLPNFINCLHSTPISHFSSSFDHEWMQIFKRVWKGKSIKSILEDEDYTELLLLACCCYEMRNEREHKKNSSMSSFRSRDVVPLSSFSLSLRFASYAIITD